MRTLGVALPVVVFGAAMALTGSVWAQSTSQPAAAQAGDTGGAAPASGAEGDQVRATVRSEGGRRVYVATGTIEVRGEIQRPYAFSLSGRSSLGYTYLEVPIHFVQEILNAVRRPPF